MEKEKLSCGNCAKGSSAHLRKPEWLKIEKGRAQCGKVSRTLSAYHLNSVCEEAACPNQGECFKNGTATFMLMGKTCTRSCSFCNVSKGSSEALDAQEPLRVAQAAVDMGLSHLVVTSVTRDDLPDGGAAHFAKTIEAIREKKKNITVEVLIPDFRGDEVALRTVLDAHPDIVNHNVETIPDFYSFIRPEADFARSIELLKKVHEISPSIYVKSGFMLGLGEKPEQVETLLMALRGAGCDIVTIGQYLQPSLQHYPVQEYVHPDQFAAYKQFAHAIGISCVASGPLVRSSYNAKEDFELLKKRARA